MLKIDNTKRINFLEGSVTYEIFLILEDFKSCSFCIQNSEGFQKPVYACLGLQHSILEVHLHSSLVICFYNCLQFATDPELELKYKTSLHYFITILINNSHRATNYKSSFRPHPPTP